MHVTLVLTLFCSVSPWACSIADVNGMGKGCMGLEPGHVFNQVPLNVFYAFQGRKAGLGDAKMGLKWITSNVERLVMTHTKLQNQTAQGCLTPLLPHVSQFVRSFGSC